MISSSSNDYEDVIYVHLFNIYLPRKHSSDSSDSSDSINYDDYDCGVNVVELIKEKIESNTMFGSQLPYKMNKAIEKYAVSDKEHKDKFKLFDKTAYLDFCSLLQR